MFPGTRHPEPRVTPDDRELIQRALNVVILSIRRENPRITEEQVGRAFLEELRRRFPRIFQPEPRTESRSASA